MMHMPSCVLTCWIFSFFTVPSGDHSHRSFLGEVLIQILLELSPLRSHLFKYNLTDNPFCHACGDFFETTDHYFFECNHYALRSTEAVAAK